MLLLSPLGDGESSSASFRAGRGRAAPRRAAVLEQGLMAQVLSCPCLWGCAAAGSTAAPFLALSLVTPREAAEMLWLAAGVPLGACSHQRLCSLQHGCCFAGVGAPGSSH